MRSSGLLNRTMGTDILAQLLATFGLAIILRNGMLQVHSADAGTAGLMGTRARHTCAPALGLSVALVAAGGIFSGIRTTFTPDVGPASLLCALEAVPLGGLAALTSPVVFRLRKGYFAIGTWAMAEVFRIGVSNLSLLGLVGALYYMSVLRIYSDQDSLYLWGPDLPGDIAVNIEAEG